jgi:predicted ATPase
MAARGGVTDEPVSRAELAILVGLPGAGKTTFFETRLAATHVHISKDRLRNVRDKQARQLALVEHALAAGRAVAVDNQNATARDLMLLLASIARMARSARAHPRDTDD